MKKQLLLCLLSACAIGTSSQAQQLTPVWEYLINQPSTPIPILTNTLNYTSDLEEGVGTSTMDSLGALTRYDENQLLLGIRENGIDETAAGANLTLAAQYPDRSLIWINPTNGAPMGIALNIGLAPVALDPDFVAAGGTPDQYWWAYTVGPDGAIYTGYKNKILRYSPNGSGGFNTNPVVVFTLTQDEINARGIDPTLWPTWRWSRLSVTGTGAGTIILAGSSSNARGNWLLTTTDGNTFTAGSFLGNGGAVSRPIKSQDPNTPDDIWTYAGIFPGNSNGTDSSYARQISSPPYTDNFFSDSTFHAPADPFLYTEKYRNNFIGALDANQELNYIAVYSTPSWNSRALGFSPRPGWLALVSNQGRFLSSHKLNITEDAELLSEDQASLFQGTIGFVTLNKLANGDVEVLWSGTIYGYGRYLVTPYGPDPIVPEGGMPPGPFPGNTVGAANWIASSGTSFDGTVAIGLEGQGPIPWSMSRYNRGDFAVRLSPLDPTAAQDNFDVLQEFPGEGSTAIPSEQAWSPNAEAGIIIPTVRTNGPIDWGDGLGGFYGVVAASTGGSSGYGYNMITGEFGTGGTDVQTGKAGDQSINPSPEGNFNFATTWFPYHQGWIGAAIDNPDASGNSRFASTNSHSAGLETNIVSWPGEPGAQGGSSVLTLPDATPNDGMIFATSTQGGSDVKIVSVAPQTNGSSWIVTARSAASSNPSVTATNNAQYQFVYIPYNASNLIGGYVNPNGSVTKSSGQFNITRASSGSYNLTIPGKTGTNGVLLLQTAAFLPGSTNLADNNFLSYQYNDDGSGTNGTFVILSRHTGDANTFPLTDTGFYFAWVDFTNPLTPVATQGSGEGPALNISKSGTQVTISWPQSANGFILEKTTQLGPNATWTTVGTVGQGDLATGYTVPAGTKTEFYRLKK